MVGLGAEPRSAQTSHLGQLRTFGDTVVRVRSLGYTGRELDAAGTSLPSHVSASLQQTRLGARPLLLEAG